MSTLEMRRNEYFKKLKDNKEKIVKFASINKIHDYFDFFDFDPRTEKALYDAEIKLSFVIDLVTKMDEVKAVKEEYVSKEETVVEKKEEQPKTLKVLKRMLPAKMKQLEELGFVLANDLDPQYSGLYVVSLPIGWKLKDYAIYDENGNCRGYVKDFCNKENEIWGIINLLPKYNVYSVLQGKGIYEVYFGTKEEKIFKAGTYKVSGCSFDDRVSERNCFNSAIAFANEKYPDWQNVSAYWDKVSEKAVK